ncbi:MAG: DUF6584 family protein, partial [bacterium]
MSKDRKKDQVFELIAAGKWDKARDMLKKILGANPEDYRLWLRLGDVYRKLEDSENALVAYRRAARGFAEAGFLVQAIACQKQLLDLKPDEDEIHEELSALYSQRGMTYQRPEKREADGPLTPAEEALAAAATAASQPTSAARAEPEPGAKARAEAKAKAKAKADTIAD